MSGPFAVMGLLLIALSAVMAVSSLNELVNRGRRRSFHHGYDDRSSDYVVYDYEEVPATKIVTYVDSASRRYKN